ncbi:DUF429 domain-containing protein [Acanthopleuribacter pedis]|uniref:DUF429 domain-containing protein n=1 Tax=Acanthopleuribacter pedis TaxID=442870 RepID=A0A8J7Q9T8_9BACT|nr:DUF429 domain-containing protein [Acanthopleuribacter pedis]MBO1320079.1 DUF429 domain-containing protein [Acanthopleuribacter pedis]
MWLAGVDGCRTGWIAVLARLEAGQLTDWRPRHMPAIEGIETLAEQPRWVALDIPIGLLEHPQKGGRLADQTVRRALGRPRASSVFSPPARSVFTEKAFRAGLGISLQGFHIMPKIREVDAWIDPDKQKRVFEAHPEWAFAQLAGAPIQHPKKKKVGRAARLAVLEQCCPAFGAWYGALGRLPRGVARDDLIDAAVLVLTARRRALGCAARAPQDPPRDARGLLMEIWG